MLEPEECKGKPFKNRWAALRTLDVGDRLFFRAEGIVPYAAVRGAAYAFAKHNGRKMRCRRCRTRPDVVEVWRVA